MNCLKECLSSYKHNNNIKCASAISERLLIPQYKMRTFPTALFCPGLLRVKIWFTLLQERKQEEAWLWLLEKAKALKNK